MSLRDHFHEPLVSQRSWESFHARWANTIGEYLHEILPPRYFTEIQVRLGSQVEADVAEFEETATESDNEEGGVALQTYAPPTATYTIPATFPDDI